MSLIACCSVANLLYTFTQCELTLEERNSRIQIHIIILGHFHLYSRAYSIWRGDMRKENSLFASLVVIGS